MLLRSFIFLLSGLAAIAAAVASLVAMALCLGQPLEDVPESWQFVPMAGEIALIVAVSIWTFRSVAKSLGRAKLRSKLTTRPTDVPVAGPVS